EVNEHPVAHVLGYISSKLLDSFGDAALIFCDDVAQVLRVENGREGSRADEIAEQDADLPSLGAVLESAGALASARNAAMASSSLRRSPTNPTPRSFKSSAVKLGRTVSSILFSRNAASYSSRPSLRSQPPTSMTAPQFASRRMIPQARQPV